MANQHDVPLKGYQPQLQSWFDYMMEGHDRAQLWDMLHEDVVFRSPVVHTPQEGREITFAYLSAAGNTLGNGTFKYTRVFDCGDKAVLEFQTEMDGIQVNGIDMIEWDEDGLITVFTPNTEYAKARQALVDAIEDIDFEVDEIQFLPKTTTLVEDDDIPLFEKFLDMLNELDDVQNVFHNAELPEQ